MIRNILVFAALAANVAAGPCKPDRSSTELLSTTIVSTTNRDVAVTAETTTTSGAESTTTTADVCVQSLTSPNGDPQLQDRKDDCQDLNRVTVSSYEVWVTSILTGRIPR